MTEKGSGKKKCDELKIVIVGDGGCGKTSLLMVYAKGNFPEKYAPSVFEKYVTTVSHRGKQIKLILYDTAEVRHFCRDIPIILIGCKTDLRKDKECIRKLRAMNQAPITYIQGEETRQQMNAELYLECSSKYQENVEDIFREATKKAFAACRKAQKCSRKKNCIIL